MHFFGNLDQFSSESEEMRHYQVMTTLLESTHLSLFHGLVPVLVALEDAAKQVAWLGDEVEVKGPKALIAMLAIGEAVANIDGSMQEIKHMAESAGFPLDGAVERYRDAGANLKSKEIIKQAMDSLTEVDWDGLAAGLVEERARAGEGTSVGDEVGEDAEASAGDEASTGAEASKGDEASTGDEVGKDAEAGGGERAGADGSTAGADG